MKTYVKNILVILLSVLFLGSAAVQAEGEPTDLYAQSAVLMDADTGRILFEKKVAACGGRRGAHYRQCCGQQVFKHCGD